MAAPVSRPVLLDYFLLLAGCALSFGLVRLDQPTGRPGLRAPEAAVRYIGHLKVEPGPRANSPALRYLVLTLPDLLRLPEGIILLWPFFFGIQRIMGRKQGLTSGEWLWVFSWLGVALLAILAAWNHWGPLPEFLAGRASWVPVVWYLILVPSIGLIAVLVLLLGLLGRQPFPWTHGLGLALTIWPAGPLAGILTLGKYGWSSLG
ncbi:MAG TPA: hypothetical protein VNK04_16845 [Gemmataceae bacterium]|nr:hypothetical protein [Gemmataceae bacterium]